MYKVKKYPTQIMNQPILICIATALFYLSSVSPISPKDETYFQNFGARLVSSRGVNGQKKGLAPTQRESKVRNFLPLVYTRNLKDEGPVLVSFLSANFEVWEYVPQTEITVVLNHAVSYPISVNYTSADGTALAGRDYEATSGVISFAPGQITQTFQVSIIDDAVDELDETILLSLSNPSNADLKSPTTSTLTILDDEQPVEISLLSDAFSVSEAAGSANITVTLSAPSWQTVSVNYQTADGTALAGRDYEATSGVISFVPGQITQTFQVSIIDDAVDELDETILLSLNNPSNADLKSPITSTLTILDDEQPVEISLLSESVSVSEAAGAANITVSLSAPSWQTVSVNYQTADGTARAGEDYTAVGGTLTFAPGETEKNVNVQIQDDVQDEPDKTFLVQLSNPVNGILGNQQTTVMILDDDGPRTVQFDSGKYSVVENDSLVTITVRLSTPSVNPVTVAYNTTDGSASQGEDYLPASGTLHFEPGETAQHFTIQIISDQDNMADETVLVTLTDPVNAILGNPAQVTLTILDNDPDSPFGLQIAALHQMQTLMLRPGASSKTSMTQEELLTIYDNAFPRLLDALVESGASWTRVFIKWSDIEATAPQEGQPPQYQWSWYDEKLGQIGGAGVRIIATIANAPSWAAASPCSIVNPDRMDDYTVFITDIVNRYKQPPYNIRTWEIQNEPDYTWPNGWAGGLGCMGYQGKEYAVMLQQAYQAIKSADPGATVLMGGVAHDWFTEYGGPFNRYFPDQVMEAGGGLFTDALNFHYFPDFHAEWERWDPNSQDRVNGWLPAPTCENLFDGLGTVYYAGGKDLIAKATHFRNRMQSCFGLEKPVWVTELAEHGYANSQASLDQQARYVIQGYVRGLAAGIEKIVWYALVTINDSYEQGLLFNDWTPKPAYFAFKTLTAELTGYTFYHQLSSPNMEIFIFRDSLSREKTVAWGSGTLTFSSSALRIVERSGNSTLVVDGGTGDLDGLQNGSIAVQVTSNPIFIQELNR
jgi:hypothetical protein